MSTLFHALPNWKSPSDDQMDKIWLAVRIARTHLLCLARPQGDHAKDTMWLLACSSPMEAILHGKGSNIGDSA